ncbi:MAG: hypothetical protein M3N25_01455 [Actinomycetota bacterium]|nr:hypothetical protein [Actinomycetota bacterium]
MSAVGGRPWRRIALLGGPPSAWGGHLLVSYLLVPPACETTVAPLHVTTAVFALAAVGSIVVGIRGVDGDGSRPFAAILLGGIFVLAIVLQGAANAMVDPCA